MLLFHIYVSTRYLLNNHKFLFVFNKVNILVSLSVIINNPLPDNLRLKHLTKYVTKINEKVNVISKTKLRLKCKTENVLYDKNTYKIIQQHTKRRDKNL